MEESKYWKRIKINIELLYSKGLIQENYSYDSFCNEFIPCENPVDNPLEKECLCDHPIKQNYRYKHHTNKDKFILGSCCIKKFSTIYKNKRICLYCQIKIKKNTDNICTECKSNIKENKKRQDKEEKEEREKQHKIIEKIQQQIQQEIKQKKYLESCKCKECGYQKKDNKYKYCFICYKKKYNK